MGRAGKLMQHAAGEARRRQMRMDLRGTERQARSDTAPLVPLKLSRPATPGADEPIQHLKPAVDPAQLLHTQLLDGPFWQRIPAYRAIDEATFLDHSWQAKNSITNPQKLNEWIRSQGGKAIGETWSGHAVHVQTDARPGEYVRARIESAGPHVLYAGEPLT